MVEQKPKAAEQVAVWQCGSRRQRPQQKQAGVWKPQMAGLTLQSPQQKQAMTRQTLQSPQQRQVWNQTVWKPLAEQNQDQMVWKRLAEAELAGAA